MKRRDSLVRAFAPLLAAPLVGACAAVKSPSPQLAKTYVLVHGAWHGGWCWTTTAAELRRMGHRVVTPTQTGLGERKHLLTGAVPMTTFVDDVINVIESEELENVILVGHSFGGLTITGVADRVAPRLRHLVYLDSIVLPPGQSLFGTLPPATAETRRKAAAQAGYALAAPAPSYFGVPDGPMADWVKRRLTPHPANTWDSAVELSHPLGNGLPKTYIACTTPQLASVARYHETVRAEPGWDFRTLATGHDAMITAPVELASLLAALG